MNAHHAPNTVTLSRACLWLLFLFETLAMLGVVGLPDLALTWVWLGYTIVAYLVLLELPLLLTRHTPRYRAHFSLLAVVLVVNYLVDAVGNLFNLFERIPIYDQVVHMTTFPWVLAALALGVGQIVRDKYCLAHVPNFLAAAALLGGAFLAIVHELIELLIDLGTGTIAGTGATGIYDTSFDLLADVAGLLVFAGAWMVYERREHHPAARTGAAMPA